MSLILPRFENLPRGRQISSQPAGLAVSGLISRHGNWRASVTDV